MPLELYRARVQDAFSPLHSSGAGFLRCVAQVDPEGRRWSGFRGRFAAGANNANIESLYNLEEDLESQVRSAETPVCA